jgi:ADP-heptose:LPS heptosyltransferase
MSTSSTTTATKELDEARASFGVTIHTWPDIDLKQDLDEVAALTAALDLVVSVGTAVACMAGALGVLGVATHADQLRRLLDHGPELLPVASLHALV